MGAVSIGWAFASVIAGSVAYDSHTNGDPGFMVVMLALIAATAALCAVASLLLTEPGLALIDKLRRAPRFKRGAARARRA